MMTTTGSAKAKNSKCVTVVAAGAPIRVAFAGDGVGDTIKEDDIFIRTCYINAKFRGREIRGRELERDVELVSVCPTRVAR